MKKCTNLLLSLLWTVSVLVGVASAVHAQTTNTFPATGNVGIGTTNPAYELDVEGGAFNVSNGGAHLTYNGLADITFAFPERGSGGRAFVADGNNSLTINYAGDFTGGVNIGTGVHFANSGISYISTGNLGIGKTSPAYTLDVGGDVNTSGVLRINGAGFQTFFQQSPANGLNGLNVAAALVNFDGYGGAVPNFPTGSWNVSVISVGNSVRGFQIGQGYSDGSPWYRVGDENWGAWYNFITTQNYTNITGLFYSNSNVGIGTTSPGEKLEVSGNIKFAGSLKFPDGSTQSTAWTGSLCGGDYAESIDVSDDRHKYEPGDVLVIDPNVEGKFLKSSEPYSMSVAGVYSTKPGVVGRRQTGAKNPDEIPMAVVGIVPTKVSTENGAIHPGDVLVTSSTPGYAMKGTDRSLLTGAIVGKAMGSLVSGNGVIEVLVSLQ